MSRIDNITQRWIERDEDAGLRHMCDEGVRRLREKPPRGHKRYTGLQFDCFGRDEVDFINGYMRRRYPDVEFYCSWIAWPEKIENAA